MRRVQITNGAFGRPTWADHKKMPSTKKLFSTLATSRTHKRQIGPGSCELYSHLVLRSSAFFTRERFLASITD